MKKRGTVFLFLSALNGFFWIETVQSKTQEEFCSASGPLRALKGIKCNDPGVAYVAQELCGNIEGFAESHCGKNVKKRGKRIKKTAASCRVVKNYFGLKHAYTRKYRAGIGTPQRKLKETEERKLELIETGNDIN